MTTLISASSLSLDFGHQPLFQALSFTLSLGDRIGLVGHNGSGKSSLLALLSGRLSDHSGQLQRAQSCRLEYVEQKLPSALMSLSARAILRDAMGAEAQDWQSEKLLGELGFEGTLANLPADQLSGGYHNRLLLGRAIAREPNLLLLDEPSNHLDLPAILWLEDFLRRWQGGFILVSHDQRLLDRVSDKTWFLRDKGLVRFDLPCGLARQALTDADEAARLRHGAEQKEIERIDASSRRVAEWGRAHDNEKLIRKARSMQKRVDRLKEEQTQLTQNSPWRLQLRGRPMEADFLMSFEGLAVRAAPSAPILFRAEDFWVKPGDRIALLGENGSGKSSLLRQCRQDMLEGRSREGLRYHPSVTVGYYDQALRQLADGDDLMGALEPFASLPEFTRKQALISAGFPYARHSQKVATLSGGERSRLLLLGLSLASHALLWLDEPTNHLDMEGKEELEEALADFEGGFLLVSHDRTLIERSCDRFWLIHEGRLEEWPDAESACARLYEGPRPDRSANDADPAVRRQRPGTEEENQDSEESLLERLCLIEERLAADLARKPRCQKPAQQASWRREIEELSACLGLMHERSHSE